MCLLRFQDRVDLSVCMGFKIEHTWENNEAYNREFEHPMWKTLGSVAKDFGQSGGNFMVIHQFIKAVRNRTDTPLNVYSAAKAIVISPFTMVLKEKNVEIRNL